MGSCCKGSGCAGLPCHVTCPRSEVVGVSVKVGVLVEVGVLVKVGVSVGVKVLVGVSVGRSALAPLSKNIWSGAAASSAQAVRLPQLIHPLPNPLPGFCQAALVF